MLLAVSSQTLLHLLAAGALTNLTDPFFLMASRKRNTYFAFESVIVDGYYLNGINYSPLTDTSNLACITVEQITHIKAADYRSNHQ